MFGYKTEIHILKEEKEKKSTFYKNLSIYLLEVRYGLQKYKIYGNKKQRFSYLKKM